MLRNLRSRRRPRYGAQVCAAISALLLLLSVSLLHSRLSFSSPETHLHQPQHDVVSDSNPLLSDSDDNNSSEDKIDELDTIEEENTLDPEDFMRGTTDFDDEDQEIDPSKVGSSSGYFFDHVIGVIRRAINKRSIDEWEEDYAGFNAGLGEVDRSEDAVGSDDVPVDEEVRRKASEVVRIEDALLLKVGRRVSPLREGWGDWFEKKGDFLRRDKMFKSSFEVMNPMNNPLLQDPDSAGVSGLTRGDRAVQKLWLSEFKRVPFLSKKPMEVEHKDSNAGVRSGENRKVMAVESDVKQRSETKRAERRTLEDNAKIAFYNKEKTADSVSLATDTSVISSPKSNGSEVVKGSSIDNIDLLGHLENLDSESQSKTEFSGNIYADGKRWGYYPGLHPWLSFSDFMNAFLRKGKCRMRVFMVWNSPPWMYSVRHQRGLESLLSHHRDACVVLFSEMIELDFFRESFLNDGYKVAVAMPNLDELLKDTPTHIFASVWFEWRKTKHYSTHYSELVRLAALYKYGGIYLDSDVIVLNSLSGLSNSVGMESQLTGISLNGAVMAFRKHSPFIMECLKEFFLTYDETRLRWNGADLLTRVARKFVSREKMPIEEQELKLQPFFIFFPIHRQNITRYFGTPTTEAELAQQDSLFKRIRKESLTFHYWNSLTSSLIPESQSLVARIIEQSCIRCSDVL